MICTVLEGKFVFMTANIHIDERSSDVEDIIDGDISGSDDHFLI